MYRRIRSDLEQAATGWRSNWPRMAAQLFVSYVLGQEIFWRFGFDQLSLSKKSRVMQTGAGQRIGDAIYDRLPHTRRALYAVKAAEVLTDLGKCYTEGKTYDRYGLAPDIVSCALTQPAWSLTEAVQKLYAVVVDIEEYREIDEEEFRVAIRCIYGSFFRYGQAAVMLALGDYIDEFMVVPLERAIRKRPMIAVLAALGIGYRTWQVTKRYNAART